MFTNEPFHFGGSSSAGASMGPLCKIPNSKSQIPKKLQIPSSKRSSHACSEYRTESSSSFRKEIKLRSGRAAVNASKSFANRSLFGIWILGFFWDLGFGFRDFVRVSLLLLISMLVANSQTLGIYTLAGNAG